jgi:hypothetical protein
MTHARLIQAMRFAGVGRRLLAAAAKQKMRVVALKACAAGRLMPEDGDRVGGGEDQPAAVAAAPAAVAPAAEGEGEAADSKSQEERGKEGASKGTPKEADGPKHIPAWKQKEMAEFPVYTSRRHPTCWYEPEEDPAFLRRLLLWALDQPGVSAVLPPG